MTKLISEEIMREFDLPEAFQGNTIPELLKAAWEKYHSESKNS
ncbi:MAG: hypothetical protein OK457_01905 [Thaumarchaeota archaeon]|nr:hypothetical protein [Nitrososphaerota archaeon]